MHRILPALLNVSSDSDDEDNPEYDIGAGMQSSSLGHTPHVYTYNFCINIYTYIYTYLCKNHTVYIYIYTVFA